MGLAGTAHHEGALEDHDPGEDRAHREQQHDQLHHGTGAHDQVGYGHGVVHGHPRQSCGWAEGWARASARAAGQGTGLRRVASMQAMSTRASHKGSPRRLTTWPNCSRARPWDRISALTSSASSSRAGDRKSTRLNSSHVRISYAVFCLKKKKNNKKLITSRLV